MTTGKKAQRAGPAYVNLTDHDRIPGARKLHDQATESLEKAKKHFEAAQNLDSAKESRLAMEFSAKSVLAVCLGRYPKTHHFSHEDTVDALKQIESASHSPLAGYLLIMCARAFLASNMWATTYNAMSYGYQEVLVRPQDLFDQDRARRALDDAQACRHRAYALLDSQDKLKSPEQAT